MCAEFARAQNIPPLFDGSSLDIPPLFDGSYWELTAH